MAEHSATKRRLLTYKDLKTLGLSFSREHLWRLESAGKFPRRLYLSPQKIAWFEDEVLAFVQARADERPTRVYRDHE